MKLYLGIDTSAYTTSLAVVDEKQQIIKNERLVLPVEKGKRGLRQSEGLFEHVKNLPVLFGELDIDITDNIQAIAVSVRPRPLADSYMPVFRAGESIARCLSSYTGVNLYEVSHQEGHIMAGLYNNSDLGDKEEFLAAHFSGGTSEILHIRRGQEFYFDIDISLAGLDLHAGQLVDRVGVAMGLPFPAGRLMEELALNADREKVVAIPSSVSSDGFSFSGAETMAMRLIAEKRGKEEIAFATLRTVANTLEKALLAEADKWGIKDILLVGGVMANSLIKERLTDRLEHPAVGLKLYFARPELSTDNAVGAALLARAIYKSNGAGNKTE